MQQPTWGSHARPWFASYYGNDSQLIGQIQAWFSAIDTDRSGQLDQAELGRALQQAGLNFGPASLKRLLTTFDLDRSGHLGVNEFVCLYQFVLALRNSFTTQDHDRSGKLDNWNEISLALANGGFQLSPQGINSVLTRFDPNRAGLTLEAYTEVALYLASLKTYFDFYAQQSQQTFGQQRPTGAPGVPGGAPGVPGGAPGVPGGAPGGYPGGAPGIQGPPGVGASASSTITINFDQLVAATPYFV